MKRLLAFVFVGLFLWSFPETMYAIEYTAPQYSSAPTGGIPISSNSITIVPPSRLFDVTEFSFCNMSSSDTLFYRGGASTATTTEIAKEGLPIFKESCKFIMLDPLHNQTSFYFSAPNGTTGIPVRWEQKGRRGGYQ